MSARAAISTVFATVLLLSAPNMVRAQYSPFESRDPIAVYVEAGATSEQQSKIRKLAKEFETTARVKIERASNLMKKMQQFSMEPMPDEQLVLSTQNEINSLQADMANARIRLMLAIRSVLTEEQRQRLVALLKEHRAVSQPGM